MTQCVSVSQALFSLSFRQWKERIIIVSTSIARLWLKPIFLGRAVRVWECASTVDVCQPSAAPLWVFFGSGTSAKIWGGSSRGVWVQVFFSFLQISRVDILVTSLALLRLSTEARRRFTDLRPNIKWINQEWRVEVVININEVFMRHRVRHASCPHSVGY